MKRSLLLLTLCCTTSSLFSQWIDNIYISPANPTSATPVTIYADISFSSGSCFEKTVQHSLVGNTVYAFALHCIGPLAFICSHTDTFQVGLLPAGNYSFVFHVNAGAAPSPCTPGIVPGPTDSLQFTVAAVTGINDTEHTGSFKISPNPATDFIKLPALAVNAEVYIYSLIGEVVRILKAESLTGNYFIGDLPNGLYLFRIIGGEEIQQQKILIMH